MNEAVLRALEDINAKLGQLIDLFEGRQIEIESATETTLETSATGPFISVHVGGLDSKAIAEAVADELSKHLRGRLG